MIQAPEVKAGDHSAYRLPECLKARLLYVVGKRLALRDSRSDQIALIKKPFFEYASCQWSGYGKTGHKKLMGQLKLTEGATLLKTGKQIVILADVRDQPSAPIMTQQILKTCRVADKKSLTTTTGGFRKSALVAPVGRLKQLQVYLWQRFSII